MNIKEYKSEVKISPKRRSQPEDELCKAFWQWCCLNPKIEKCTYRIEHRGNRSIAHAMKLKNMGVKAGIADYFIMHSAYGYHGLWIEMKHGKGKQSEAQLAFEEMCKMKGYLYLVINSIEDAIKTVQGYFGE